MKEIFFQSHPTVTLGGNTFYQCETIIKYKNTPLLEVGRFVPAGYSARFPVYHNDGTKLAVVSGGDIRLTEEGRKANLKCRHESNLTVCELDGKAILELRKRGAAALHGWAELYAPKGVLITATDSGICSQLHSRSEVLIAGGWAIKGLIFKKCICAIHIVPPEIFFEMGRDGSLTVLSEMNRNSTKRSFNVTRLPTIR